MRAAAIRFAMTPVYWPRPGTGFDGAADGVRSRAVAQHGSVMLHIRAVADLFAGKVGGVVRAASALVSRDLRIRAQRPRSLSALGHDLRRRRALLDPALDRRIYVVDRISGGSHAALPEVVRPGAAA